MGKREQMRRKLDSWLGRSDFKTDKLKSLLDLTISRLAVLKNKRQRLCNLDRDDVAQLLQQGHQEERALLRADKVVKEQNLLDVFAMLESYCNVLMERAVLLEHSDDKECPDELREAIASLIFAASRSGELPELQEVRSIFASRFGKEFVASAVELRNNCLVDVRLIQKLSTKQSSLESRVKVIEDIAAEKGITHDLPALPSSDVDMEESNLRQSTNLNEHLTPPNPLPNDDYNFSKSMETKERFQDAESAAQAAFESAAYAAEAARTAVELSRAQPRGKGSGGDRGNPGSSGKNGYDDDNSKVSPNQTFVSELEEQEMKGKSASQLQKSASASSSSSTEIPSRGKKETVYHTFEDKNKEKEWNSDEDDGFPLQPPYRKQSPVRSQDHWDNSSHEETGKVGLRYADEDGRATYYADEGSRMDRSRIDAAEKLQTQRLATGKGPISMRTRRSGI